MATPEPILARRSARSYAISAVRWLVSISLCVFLVRRLELEALPRQLEQLPGLAMVAMLGLIVAQQCLLTLRLYWVLRSFASFGTLGSKRLTWSSVLLDQQVGMAFNAVLPSSLGGDVVRSLRIAEYFGASRGALATTAVLVDRVIGLLALCTTPVVAALVLQADRLPLFALVALAGVIAAIAWKIELAPRALGALTPRRFPQIKQWLEDTERALIMLPVSQRAIVYLWALVYQLTVGAFFEVASSGWNLPAARHQAIWVGIPAAMVGSVAPIAVGGLGLRESLFAEMFRLFGLAGETGLALALLWAVNGLLTAGGGVAVLLLERRRAIEPSTKP